MLSDEQIDSAMRGERAAVAALVRAFMPRVFGLCLRLGRDRDLAEEASQEAFVQVLRHLPRLRRRDRLESWVLTIAANATRKMLKTRTQKRDQPLTAEPPAPEPARREDDPRRRALERAVSELAVDERQIFLLHTVEGVRLKELAEDYQTTVSAMKARIHRIRAKLRARALAQLECPGEAL